MVSKSHADAAPCAHPSHDPQRIDLDTPCRADPGPMASPRHAWFNLFSSNLALSARASELA
eukprot:9959530-Karenia_brevis.AAC.1